MATTIADLIDPTTAHPVLLAPRLPAWDGARARAVVDRLASELVALGAGRRRRVATFLPNGRDTAALLLAAMSAGSLAPLNPRFTADEVRAALADLRPVLLVVAGDAPFEGEVYGVRVVRLIERDGEPTLAPGVALPGTVEPPQLSDEALVLQTSGTTARPKIVPLTQANLLASAANIGRTLALSSSDRSLCVMPLFHIHGIVAALLSPLAAGGSVACPPNFDGFRFFDWLTEVEPTWYSAVPTMHQVILSRADRNAEAVAASRLRFIRSSSASLPTTVMLRLEEVFGVPVIEAYGMTEASHQMTSNPLPPAVRKPGAVGLGVGVEVAIADTADNILPRGATGEVVIRGANVTAGYAENEAANRVAFFDGWFRTGDEGVIDEDGYLSLTGRLKELINRGGEKVSPREVEEALLQHAAVAEAAVFALPHPALGEEVAAAVVLRQPAAEADLRAYLAGHLAPYKVPRCIVTLEAMPLGPTGKVQRVGMAARLGLV